MGEGGRAPINALAHMAPDRGCRAVLLDPTLARADPVGTAGAANVLSSGTPPGGNMKVI